MKVAQILDLFITIVTLHS